MSPAPRNPRFLAVLGIAGLVLLRPDARLTGDDSAPTGALTITVGEKVLDLAALKAREAALRIELDRLNESPTTDADARRQAVEPRATLVSALKGAEELIEQIEGAPALSSKLEAELSETRASLVALQKSAATGPRLESPVDDERIRTIEAQATKAAQDATNVAEAASKWEEALKKRQSDIESVPARRAELKARGDALVGELEKLTEDAAHDREVLSIQIETNLVRRGVADLRQSRHAVLFRVDTLRRDLALAQLDVARVQQTIADGTVAKSRLARQEQLAEEARRREADSRRKLREAELAASPAVKAIKRIEALVGRMETDHIQDSKRLSELKTLGDDASSFAQMASARVISLRLLYPEGETVEPSQREDLFEQVSQQDLDELEFDRFLGAHVPDLNAMLAQVLTHRARLVMFGDRLARAQDRLELGESDEARVAAVEHELARSRDDDYRLWLHARLDFLRGQAELRTDEVARFRAEWDKNTGSLKTLVKSRVDGLGSIRSKAEELRATLSLAVEALRSRRQRLDAIALWLREPSLFETGALAAATSETARLVGRVASLPDRIDEIMGAFASGGESARRRAVEFGVAAGGALAFCLWLRRRLRATATDARPFGVLGRGAANRRALAIVARTVCLPVSFVLVSLYLHGGPLSRNSGTTGLVALGAIWASWALARAVNRAFFRPDGEGICLVACSPRTSRSARRILGTLLIGSGVLLASMLVLRALGAARLTRFAGFAWGVLAVAVGTWIAVRRDVLGLALPSGRGGLLARTAGGSLRLAWPLVVAAGAVIVALDARGYRTAAAFFAARGLWCAAALLALGVVHAVLRALLRRQLVRPEGDATDRDAEPSAASERRDLVKRLLGGLLTLGVLAGFAVILSLVFELRRADWDRIGAVSLTGGDSGADFTLGRLSRALLIFWLTIELSRFVRDVVRAALRARNMNRGSRYAVRTLLFYTMVTLGTVAALAALGLELSQLGWFLTAAGVGIGFGLQEIISNFVSGLILFFERPVQVGDVVSVGEVLGDVQQINIRSTIVRTRDGVAIIIPNKRLITEDVVNWSHGDQRTRIHVPVGIAYGSDVARVKEILLEIAAEDTRVLKRPAPEVSFSGFGESDMRIELLVWLPTPDPTLRRLVSSTVNTRIDERFREEGVVIPMPQREIHFHGAQRSDLSSRPDGEGPTGRTPGAPPTAPSV